MNCRHPYFLSLIACLGVASGTMAQSPPDDGSESDPVLDAIRKFTENSPPNEITVVLPPPKAQADEQNHDSPDESDAVLVTGRPAENAVVEGNAEPDAHAADENMVPPGQEQLGPTVRVERLKTAAESPSGTKLELKAPFPAKPLSAPPAGWIIDVASDAPAFKRQVEIAPGTTVNLEIRPHVLSPEADGHQVFAVSEPRYSAELGYRQSDTVGAILGQSLQHHNEDARKLSAVIDELQQMLISLPAPEPEEAEPNGSP